MQTVRFSKVVKDSGSPEIYLMWKEPAKDTALRKLVAQRRVMTLAQPRTGTKKDWGEVGLGEDLGGQILVFPKSLGKIDGKRVVGIDYHLLKTPPEASGRPAKKPTTARQKPAASTRGKVERRQAENVNKESREEPADNIIQLPPQKAEAPSQPKRDVKKAASRFKKAKAEASAKSNALVRKKAKSALAAWKNGNQLPAYELIESLAGGR
ncbi:hypothetical protein [Verrucomicrobium sp. BvORR034]|uniref:hypothetical protein n=1 Tax=Verrucomicrobium sp. BvORR034 TaxID=1396418 RepID=UPI000679105B|nr:hypothetical protein [Verrucomicrobium sp. BvORR034]